MKETYCYVVFSVLYLTLQMLKILHGTKFHCQQWSYFKSPDKRTTFGAKVAHLTQRWLPNYCMTTSALIGSRVCGGSLIFGAAGDESGPGQAKGRWAVMEADIWGLRHPEPSLSPAAARLGWPGPYGDWRWPGLHGVPGRWANWLERPR